jgi:hypothetical protein
VPLAPPVCAEALSAENISTIAAIGMINARI